MVMLHGVFRPLIVIAILYLRLAWAQLHKLRWITPIRTVSKPLKLLSNTLPIPTQFIQLIHLASLIRIAVSQLECSVELPLAFIMLLLLLQILANLPPTRWAQTIALSTPSTHSGTGPRSMNGSGESFSLESDFSWDSLVKSSSALPCLSSACWLLFPSFWFSSTLLSLTQAPRPGLDGPCSLAPSCLV